MKKSKIKALVCAGLLSVSALSMTACNNKQNSPATVVWTADSAYVRALDEGFTGTFEEFLETLSGIKQAEINSNGNLILKLGDDSTIDVGKVKGNNGFTPEIGANGNWWIGGVDTTIKAQGEKGDTGLGIAKIEKTNTNGLVDTYTITYTNNTTSTFTVTNGTNGTNGVSIQDLKVEEGNLLIKLSNSETFTNLGSVNGEKGDTGVGIVDIEQTSDRWGILITTKYTYSDSTIENPHIEEITTNNGTSFGRVYDAKTSEEFAYLIENNVTNIAITSQSEDFYITSDIICDVKDNPIYDSFSNQYLHYTFDLNGHVLKFTNNLTFDGVNVLIKNGLVQEDTFGIIKENNANVSITHTYEKVVESLSESSVNQASNIINEINTKVYNSKSLATSTHYTLAQLNSALGENALSNYYVEVENTSIYYKTLTIGGTTYKKGQIVSLSIGMNNFIDSEAYYVENGKLYVSAPIVATASAEQEPYTISDLVYDTSAFEITEKGNNEFNVIVKKGTEILYIKINGVEQSDLFLRKAIDNGNISFGFTGTDKVPNENTYSYGLYPVGWVENVSQYAGFTREFIADLYIVGKGTVHFKLNIIIPSNIK